MKNYKSMVAGLFLLPLLATAQTKPAPQLGRNSIKEVMAAMTLEEKVTLLVGTGKAPKPTPPAPGVSNGWVPEPTQIGYTEFKVPGAAGNSAGIERLGIPGLVFADGPAGVRISPTRKNDTRTYYATAWPVGTMLATTWNTELIEEVGRAFGNEVHEYGVDVLLAPGVNIHRNPLNGRNFEYYSEDPLVAGKTAAAFINGVESNGVGTSIKHYVANNQESNRNYVSSTVSERALREIYLKPFEIAIREAQPWTVMSSYNRVNGKYTAESTDLLTTVLRDEWKFKGFVITDWGGGYDAVEEMRAGNDVIMPGRPDQIESIIAAVKNSKLSMKDIDRNVEHVLSTILDTPSFKGYQSSDAPDLKAHAAIARKAATEGMVLLKNTSDALPIATTSKKVAAFGWASYYTIPGGTGSGEVNKAYVTSIFQGLLNAGYSGDERLQKMYADKQALTKAEINTAAANNDIAVVTIVRISGEGHDREVENNYKLTAEEQQEFKQIADAFHARGKKVIAVLNIGGVIDMKGWQDNADAVLLAWQPGQEAGDAIADVLSGKVNPSGKLPMTFPMQYEDVPSAKNFPGTPNDKPEYVLYEEGIYVGYRYYDTFNVKPMYEFGYGLSYTTFAFENLNHTPVDANGTFTVSVTVRNTGNAAGKEVVQLYVTAPKGTLDKPAHELKAFAKTKLLQPGESQVVTLSLTAADLASFETDKSAWITEKGTYTLNIGSSSRNLALFTTKKYPQTIVVQKTHPLTHPDKELRELRR